MLTNEVFFGTSHCLGGSEFKTVTVIQLEEV